MPDDFQVLAREFSQELSTGVIDESDITVAIECGCGDPLQHNEQSDD